MNVDLVYKRSIQFGTAGALAVVVALGAMTVSSVARSDDKSTTGDVGRGARAWAENCMRCHNARDPREFRDDLWKPVIYHMRVRGGLTGQQTRDILAYIQASN